MIITISGACHSGKTTFGKRLEDEIPGAKFYDEIVRTHDFDSIDELRENSNQYFQFERKVIKKKIEQERELYRKDGVHILDRNLIDNLYYYLRFINENQLTDNNKKEYNKFLNEIIDLSNEHSHKIYDEVVLMNYIRASNDGDTYRPANLIDVQKGEYKLIRAFIKSFVDENKIYRIYAPNERQNLDYIRRLKTKLKRRD